MSREVKFKIEGAIEGQDVTMNKDQGKVPPRPKKGEYIVCQFCGEEMKPQDFSTNKLIRKEEFKWHYHYECKKKVVEKLDETSSNIILERESKRRNSLKNYIQSCLENNIPMDIALNSLEQQSGRSALSYPDILKSYGIEARRLSDGKIEVLRVKTENSKPRSMLDRL